MNITMAVYSFHQNKVIIKVPFEIVKETNKCYFTKNARFLKEEIGSPILKSATTYPYIELVMVDANEETLRETLSKWFTHKAFEVWSMAETPTQKEEPICKFSIDGICTNDRVACEKCNGGDMETGCCNPFQMATILTGQSWRRK